MGVMGLPPNAKTWLSGWTITGYTYKDTLSSLNGNITGLQDNYIIKLSESFFFLSQMAVWSLWNSIKVMSLESVSVGG